jgi:hypothetical protein
MGYRHRLGYRILRSATLNRISAFSFSVMIGLSGFGPNACSNFSTIFLCNSSLISSLTLPSPVLCLHRGKLGHNLLRPDEGKSCCVWKL